MKVFAMLCFYILLLYLQLPVTYGDPMQNSATEASGADDSRSNAGVLATEKKIIPLGGDDSEFEDFEDFEDSSLMNTYNEMINRGNELKKQYYPLVAGVAEWMGKRAQNWTLPESVINSIPILKLVMDSVTSANGQGVDEFGKIINLKNTLNHPELVKSILSHEFVKNVALKSMEMAAGENVSQAVDKFMEEVTKESTDTRSDGTVGITGEHLLRVFNNSEVIKNLFPKETTEAAETMITMLNNLLTPKEQNAPVAQTDENSSPLSRTFSMLTRSVSNVAASAAASVTATTAGKFMAQKVAYKAVQVFLPVGFPKTALKLLCILTYLMLVAHREDLMPRIDPVTVARINSTTGLELGTLIDKLNNKDIMQKVFPLHDESNYAVKVLKFLAGDEVTLIEKVAMKLRQFKEKCGKVEVTMNDLIKDTVFFNEIMKMPELALLRSLIYGEQKDDAVVGSTNSKKDESVQAPSIPSSILNTPVVDGSKQMADYVNASMKKTEDDVVTTTYDEKLSEYQDEDIDEATAIQMAEVASAYEAVLARDASNGEKNAVQREIMLS